LWALRRAGCTEERRNLLNATARPEERTGFTKHAGTQRERANETRIHIERIRDILLTSTEAMAAGIHPKH